jgi:hypothetical protein
MAEEKLKPEDEQPEAEQQTIAEEDLEQISGGESSVKHEF